MYGVGGDASAPSGTLAGGDGPVQARLDAVGCRGFDFPDACELCGWQVSGVVFVLVFEILVISLSS
jgi:hypothetical protein